MDYTHEHVLNRVPLCLKAGLFSEAAHLLEDVEAATPPQAQELAYLRAWTLAASGHFDEAAQTLLLTDLFADVLTEKIHELGQTERRRRAPVVLMLGRVAFTLGRYDEAATHFLQCLTFLHARRMNDPRLRMQALFSLGCAYEESGLFAAALAQLQAALALCQDHPEHPGIGAIFSHLATTSASQRQYQQAQCYAEQALQWSMERNEREQEMHMHSLFGQILSQQGAYEQARQSFYTALTMATRERHRLMMLANTVALAEAHYGAKDLNAAQISCDEALTLLETQEEFVSNPRAHHLKGQTYLICGKVAQARSQQAHGPESRDFLAQAERWYTRAIEVLQQSKEEQAQAYKLLALLLEESHREEQALFFWRQAYAQASQA